MLSYFIKFRDDFPKIHNKLTTLRFYQIFKKLGKIQSKEDVAKLKGFLDDMEIN